MAGRPQLLTGDTQTLFGRMGQLSVNRVLNVKNKSFAVTGNVTVPGARATGVIIAQGGRFGGWSLHIHRGGGGLAKEAPSTHTSTASPSATAESTPPSP